MLLKQTNVPIIFRLHYSYAITGLHHICRGLNEREANWAKINSLDT